MAGHEPADVTHGEIPELTAPVLGQEQRTVVPGQSPFTGHPPLVEQVSPIDRPVPPPASGAQPGAAMGTTRLPSRYSTSHPSDLASADDDP